MVDFVWFQSSDSKINWHITVQHGYLKDTICVFLFCMNSVPSEGDGVIKIQIQISEVWLANGKHRIKEQLKDCLMPLIIMDIVWFNGLIKYNIIKSKSKEFAL